MDPVDPKNTELQRYPPPRDPHRTKAAIISGATAEFTLHGFAGASVNEIAARVGVNKRLLYHYFASKEALFIAVLEQAYRAFRDALLALDIATLSPPAQIRALTEGMFDHFVDNPEFLRLANIENMYEGRHLDRSTIVPGSLDVLVRMVSDILGRGSEKRIFRDDVDAVEFCVTAVALAYYGLANRHTLSRHFGIDLGTTEAVAARRVHVVDVLLGYLRR